MRNLDGHSQFRAGEDGQVITLRFSGTRIWEVTITGTSLRQLDDGIHRHMIPWFRKSDRGFAARSDGEPLIMGIEIEPIPREEWTGRPAGSRLPDAGPDATSNPACHKTAPPVHPW
jgi:hypothetical protein